MESYMCLKFQLPVRFIFRECVWDTKESGSSEGISKPLMMSSKFNNNN